MPINKTCVICGKAFTVPPSEAQQECCSKKCGAALRTKHGLREIRWSDEAKQRRSQDPTIQNQMKRIQKVGVEAALKLPEGQRGEQNREAKVWTLIDPDGNYHRVVNLLDWGRKNKGLFFEPDVPEDIAARRIAQGFRAIASYMRGVASRTRPVTTYKNWRLACLPEDKEPHEQSDGT